MLRDCDPATWAWVRHILELLNAESQGALGVYIRSPSARVTALLHVARLERDAITAAWAKWYRANPPKV